MVLLLTLNSLERPLTVPLLSSTDFFTATTISSDLRGLDIDHVVASGVPLATTLYTVVRAAVQNLGNFSGSFSPCGKFENCDSTSLHIFHL
uniref:Uncharacterized protein n=1 Tax=Lepeophtheirus salmonis TaxID=72036 RepID=A0A0K2TFK8_LEPSM